jgi:hypothetical protein
MRATKKQRDKLQLANISSIGRQMHQTERWIHHTRTDLDVSAVDVRVGIGAGERGGFGRPRVSARAGVRALREQRGWDGMGMGWKKVWDEREWKDKMGSGDGESEMGAVNQKE